MLRLTDRRPLQEPPAPGETFVAGDLTDPAFVADVVRDVTAVLHLGGHPIDADWPTLLSANLTTTTLLCDRAAERGIRSIVFTSSIHAIGGYNDPTDWPVPGDTSPRPCCRYGVGKAACEAVLRLYSDQVDRAAVCCLRLPLVTYQPRTSFEPRSWLAESDLARLVDCAFASTRPFGIYVGTSICPQPRFDISRTIEDLGYRPQVRSDQALRATERPSYAPRCDLWRPFLRDSTGQAPGTATAAASTDKENNR